MKLQDIKKAVESKDFSKADDYLGQACKQLGYSKIGECSDSEKLKPYAYSMELMPGVKMTAAFIPIAEEAGGKCVHYGNSSKKLPEGVIYGIPFFRNSSKLFTSNDIREIKILGYGERWWDAGNIVEFAPCHKEMLKVPKEVVIASELDLDSFIEEIRNMHSVKIPIS